MEGTIAGARRVCRGIPLSPVKVSVMREINRSCNTLLPSEDGLNPPPPVTNPSREPFPADKGELQAPFDFDSDYLTLRTTRIVSEAARIAKLAKAERVDTNGLPRPNASLKRSNPEPKPEPEKSAKCLTDLACLRRR